MVWVCPQTGEMRDGALDDAKVDVVTSPTSLVSKTKVRARSNSLDGAKAVWKWVEEEEMSATQKEQLALIRKDVTN